MKVPPQTRPRADDDSSSTSTHHAHSRPRRRLAKAALLLPLLLGSAAAATDSLDCKKIETEGWTFDFGALAGPHSVVTSVYHEPRFTNETYTLDICGPLKRKDDDASKDRQCADGTWVCKVTEVQHTETNTTIVDKVIAIAGNTDSTKLDPTITRLSTSAEEADKGKVGVRINLHGGMFEQRKKMAVVEMLCKEDVEGTEGEWTPADFPNPPAETPLPPPGKRDDSSVPKQLRKPDAALIWEGFGTDPQVPDTEILKLTWHTKHACETSDNTGGGGGSQPGGETSSWGFFTWMVVIVFLGAAAYLIFGSWLNYTRYGARGWDLLPHGDTIRDVPYLLQDWTRRLINTLQGSGSRGGYSAV